MNSSPVREEAIFTLALGKSAAERGVFLDRECGSDVALRQRLEALLAAHEQKDSVLATEMEAAARPTLSVHVPDEPPDEAVGQTLGRYKLLEKIGEGGCGVVYVAEQTEPVRRRVALKIIKLGMDTKQVVARFEAERQALAMMDHPNIAKILDAGVTGNADFPVGESPSKAALPHAGWKTGVTGRPYFVMELVRGIRITDYCDQANLSTQERLDLFIKVCQAIQHAHQKGIIHRDIKPSNILVTLHDGVPVPKVIDFGIAKAIEGRLTDATVYTQLHQFIGTPAYMSPEQAEMSGLDIDTRSDIYSLGVLLYELLAGSTPFDAKELMASGIDAMRKTIREREPMRPSTRLTQALVAVDVSPHQSTSGVAIPTQEEVSEDSRRRLRLKEQIHRVQGDLDWIVMKCLEKDRGRRYETANGLAADLKRHLNNEPVVARPPSTAYRFQKAFRRNRLVFTAATLVVTALVLGIGVSTWQTFAARKAQRETEVARKGEQKGFLEAQSARKIADEQARIAVESREQSRRLLYAAEINLAQQSLKLNNLGRARRLLDRHRPQSGEEDLRGWEWRYLWQLTRSSALVTLTNRRTPGFSVSFSPDGKRLAVGWRDGHVDLWDVPGRRLVRALTQGEFANVGTVAFSPVRNLLAATSAPKAVTLYDLDSGQESLLWRAPDQGDWMVHHLAFSKDGSRVVISARAGEPLRDSVWVVNVSSAQEESFHPIPNTRGGTPGRAQLSPDNHRLYLARSDNRNRRYSIQCIDLSTGQELWQSDPESDVGVTTLALSPDGRVLASGSGFEDSTIRVWDTATGRLLVPLEGHTAYVCDLAFTQDGRRLISAARDQTLRFWDTSTWKETKLLRGHTDAVNGVAVSDSAQLVASASKDGNLMLWEEDGKSAALGYSRLSEEIRMAQLMPLDHSRVLLLPPGQPPQWVDLKHDSAAVSLPGIGSSANVLDSPRREFGTNTFCHWNGTNQILVSELRGAELIQRGAITLDSGTRPFAFAYHAERQLLAWTDDASSRSVHLASLAAPVRRTELRTDVSGLVLLSLGKEGDYLAGATKSFDTVGLWNIESGQRVVSIGEYIFDGSGAVGGRVYVATLARGNDHEIVFYDLVHPDRAPRRIPGEGGAGSLAVSPDGGLVASCASGGLVRLFDPAKGEWIDDLHGHLSSVVGAAFSPDGRRLISTSGGREAVKLWDVSTRQELLTLAGTGSMLGSARWSADGDVILVGTPWQAWRAPSWEEIAAAEAKESALPKRP